MPGSLCSCVASQSPKLSVINCSAPAQPRYRRRFWPVRRYPWGSCEALLSTHSDLPALRRLRLETGYWDLKEVSPPLAGGTTWRGALLSAGLAWQVWRLRMCAGGGGSC